MTMRRGYPIVALAAVVVAVAAVALTGSGSSRVLYATFQSATNLVDGNYVTVGGVKVGSVSGIALHGAQARVALSIDNAKEWPLHQGTTAEIRFGGTASYSDRYVELIPGPVGAPPLRDGARLPLTDTTTPVEFDQLFNVFTPAAREGLGRLVDNGATTFGARAGALRAGLIASPPAFDQTAQVLTELGYDPHALQTLVASGASVAQSLSTTQPQLLDLVGGASTTLGEIATHARVTEAALARLPGTLDAARHTLTALNPTLSKLHGLVGDLGPGVMRLRALAGPLSDAVATLRTVAPELDQTLGTVHRSAPQVSALLSDARPLALRAAPALSALEPIVGCVRAYTPELAGFAATWHSLGIFHDANGVYGRVTAQEFPFSDVSTSDSAQLVKSTPDLLYSLVRPPGYNAGRSWQQPSCDAGAAGLNPSLDPEAAR